MKFYIFFLIIVGILFPLQAQTVVFQENTPAWRPKGLDNGELIIFNEEIEIPYCSVSTDFFRVHPLMRPIRVYEIELPEVGRFLASPNLYMTSGRVHHYSFFRPTYLLLSLLSFIFSAYFAFRWKKSDVLLQKKLPHLPALCVLLGVYYSVFFWFQTFSGAYENPLDEKEYFRIAMDLGHGVIGASEWLYTLGLPIIYLAISRIFSIADIDTLTLFGSWIFSCFASPLLLVSAYYVFYRLSRNRLYAVIPLCFQTVFMLFYSYGYELSDTLYCTMRKSIFTRAMWDMPFYIHQKNALFGFNIDSDTPAAACVLAVFAILFLMKRPLVVCSTLFSFACLLRVNCIMFAPAIFFLLVLKYRDTLCQTWKNCFFFLLSGAFCFLLIFSIQFFSNYREFGHPLTFPYVLHGHMAGKGFLLSSFENGMNFVIGVDFVPFVLGVAGMFLIENRIQRAVMILITVPICFFFFGYPVAVNCGTRWFLAIFPFLFFAPFAGQWMIKLSVMKQMTLLIPVLFTIFCVAPCDYSNTRMLPLNLHTVEYGSFIAWSLTAVAFLLCISGLILLKKEKRAFAFLSIFTILFFPGCTLLVCAGLCILLVWGVYDSIRIMLSFRSTELDSIFSCDSGE